MLNIKIPGMEFNFGAMIDKNEHDPVVSHQQHFSVGDKDNWLDDMENKAHQLRKDLANWGIDEKLCHKAKDGTLAQECPLDTKKIDYDENSLNISEVAMDNQKRSFYHMFFESCAQRDDLEFVDNDDETNASVYKAKLTRKDGDKNTTNISIDNNRNVIMNATKPDGTKIVPDQKRFDDLAELAYQQKCSINFGNISSDEYRARLYLACINHKPTPIAMTNAPDVTNQEFLAQLDDATRQALTSDKGNNHQTNDEVTPEEVSKKLEETRKRKAETNQAPTSPKEKTTSQPSATNSSPQNPMPIATLTADRAGRKA